MKKIAIFLVSVLCMNLNAQKGKLFTSEWRENESSEMNVSSDKYSYFEKGKLYYHIANNDKYIIVDMKVEDAGVQNRILKEGLTIWINMDGKSNKTTGVRFPIGSEYSGGRNRSNVPAVRVASDGSLVTPLAMANTIQLTGFENANPSRFPADNADNFRGWVKYDSEGTLLYNMVIPIEKLPIRNSKEGDGAMPFTFGIEYGAPPVMTGPPGAGAARPMSAAPEGGSRGGGGGRSGGGGGGGRGAGGVSPGGSSQTSPSPVILWIKDIKLATS
jgi:hypothetical protein